MMFMSCIRSVNQAPFGLFLCVCESRVLILIKPRWLYKEKEKNTK